VATELYRLGHRVVVTAGPGEEQVAELIADRSHAEALPGLPLEELASLIAHARLVISGDTGVAHLASAYARPSVTLFGPVSPSEWGPPEHPRHQVLFVGNGKGDPHAERCDPALLAISVSDVLAASERAIRTDHSGVPARPDRSSTTR
jgi:ADP-heptose:LPS heptosyltransferase